MAESRTKSSARHLARVLETGAALLDHGDADAAPARLVNAHLTAIRTLGGESEAAEAVCEAIRTRRMTPIAPASLIEASVATPIEAGAAARRDRGCDGRWPPPAPWRRRRSLRWPMRWRR